MILFYRLLILTILFFQSISDLRTKTVYVFPNNLLLIFSGIYFSVRCIQYEHVHIAEIVFTIILLIILGLTKKIGPGDIKAMISMYLSIDGIFELFILYLIISCISFVLIEEIIKPLRQNHKNKNEKIKLGSVRAAFFPYLCFSYLIDLILIYASLIYSNFK